MGIADGGLLGELLRVKSGEVLGCALGVSEGNSDGGAEIDFDGNRLDVLGEILEKGVVLGR